MMIAARRGLDPFEAGPRIEATYRSSTIRDSSLRVLQCQEDAPMTDVNLGAWGGRILDNDFDIGAVFGASAKDDDLGRRGRTRPDRWLDFDGSIRDPWRVSFE